MWVSVLVVQVSSEPNIGLHLLTFAPHCIELLLSTVAYMLKHKLTRSFLLRYVQELKLLAVSTSI